MLTMIRALLAAAAVVVSLPVAAQVKLAAVPEQSAALQSDQLTLAPGMKFFAQQWCKKDPSWGVEIKVESVSSDGLSAGVSVLTKCWNQTWMFEPQHKGKISLEGNQIKVIFWRSVPQEDFARGATLQG